MSTVNPYAPPKAHVEDVSTDSAAEAVRREHIKHEASVRSIGALYYLGGGFMLLAALGFAVGGFEPAAEANAAAITVIVGVFYGVLGIVSLVVAYGIRRLQPWARIASIVLSAISLLAIPIGTIVSGYILYLLLSAKGQRLFAPDYADIVAATPHVKYRTSIVVWIVLGLLLLLIVGLILASALSR